MELLTQLLNALWAQDFETLANPSMIGMLYFALFTILFPENGLLPAVFLPVDIFLVLSRVLCATSAMALSPTAPPSAPPGAAERSGCARASSSAPRPTPARCSGRVTPVPGSCTAPRGGGCRCTRRH